MRWMMGDGGGQSEGGGPKGWRCKSKASGSNDQAAKNESNCLQGKPNQLHGQREKEKGGAGGDGVEKHRHEAVERLELS